MVFRNRGWYNGWLVCPSYSQEEPFGTGAGNEIPPMLLSTHASRRRSTSLLELRIKKRFVVCIPKPWGCWSRVVFFTFCVSKTTIFWALSVQLLERGTWWSHWWTLCREHASKMRNPISHKLFGKKSATVLLVVLEHPNIFYLRSYVLFPAVLRTSRPLPIHILHIPALLPSHSLGYISWSLPRCESVRIASISPTCALPFPIIFAMCVSQDKSFEISTPREVYLSAIGSPYLRYIQYCAFLDVCCHPPFPSVF